MGIRIVTDSTANIDRQILRELNILEVSLSVNIAEKSYKEAEITNAEFYELMAKSPKVPTSSQPSPLDFYEVFCEALEEGHDIVGIFISSDLSGTYYSAQTAKNMILVDKPQAHVEIIDSRTTTMQLGLGVIAGARAVRDGLSLEEVVAKIRCVLENSSLYFVPKTLEYLKIGGRIGGASALIGTLLQVKPILTIQHGKVAVVDKVRTFEKAVNKALEELLSDSQAHNVREVTVLHINCLEEAHKFAAIVREKSGLPARIATIGPVIGLHVGPGTLGLTYFLE